MAQLVIKTDDLKGLAQTRFEQEPDGLPDASQDFFASVPEDDITRNIKASIALIHSVCYRYLQAAHHITENDSIKGVFVFTFDENSRKGLGKKCSFQHLLEEAIVYHTLGLSYSDINQSALSQKYSAIAQSHLESLIGLINSKSEPDARPKPIEPLTLPHYV